jgi:hypothetical protein
MKIDIVMLLSFLLTDINGGREQQKRNKRRDLKNG